jgi:FtsP/CotA-like multicopper oxidase with cupredoxin domain
MIWSITRRKLLLAAAAFAATPAFAQEDAYGNQTLSLETTVVNLLGPDQPNTQRFVIRTAGDLPILRAKQGQRVTFQIFNKLAEDVWLHFFGVRAEAEAVTIRVPKGTDGSVSVSFVPPDAGTFWVGPLLNAARQREMGLQALLIVDPAVADERYADVPLIIDDWLIGDDGKIKEDFRNVERAAGEGRLGNWYTVNGKYKPRLTLPRERPARLRVVNVCNSRTLTMQIKGAEALIIARDGQPISAFAVPATGLVLAPGQRADVVLAAAFGEQVVLALDLFEDVVEAGFLLVDGALPSLPDTPTLAANIFPTVDETVPPREIPITIEGGIKGGMTSAKVGDTVLDLRTMLERGLAWSINGVAGPSGVATFEAVQGEVLVLVIENKTVFDQPLALHGHLWHQLELDRQKSSGQSWRDTAVIPALATARYVMVAERAGLWGLHSLVAERSDAGLFGGFKVTDKP